MNLTNKFAVLTDQCEVYSIENNLTEAVLIAAQYDGHGAVIKQLSGSNWFGLYRSRHLIGNNTYFPADSDLVNDSDAPTIDSCALKVYVKGDFHAKYAVDVLILGFLGDILTLVGGQSISHYAEKLEITVDEVRAMFAAN